MHHPLSRHALATAFGIAAISLSASSASAAQVTFRFTTSVNSINPAHASFPASLAGVAVGAPVSGTITYDTASPAGSPIPSAPFSAATRYTLNSAKYKFIIGGVTMNSWTGQPNAFVWNNDVTVSGGPIVDALIYTNFATPGSIQFQLGSLGLPTGAFGSEALPTTSLRNSYVLEMYGAGGAGGVFLRTNGWAGWMVVPNCLADVNGDVQVNVTDLLSVIGAWGTGGTGVSNPSDINSDNQVNVTDLLAVISAWGACP